MPFNNLNNRESHFPHDTVQTEVLAVKGGTTGFLSFFLFLQALTPSPPNFCIPIWHLPLPIQLVLQRLHPVTVQVLCYIKTECG